jgi:hypothetical protein
MSMNAEYVAVSPEELTRFIAGEISPFSLFMPDIAGGMGRLWTAENLALIENLSPDVLANAVQNLDPRLQAELTERIGRVQAAIAGGQTPATMPRDQTEPTSGRRKLSLDKAWHGVHYLLTGEPESTSGSLGNVVLGGTEIGDDEGYGPARCFTTSEVAQLARVLDQAGIRDEAAARYDSARMSDLGIYPGGWDEEGRDWLLDALDELRAFFVAVAATGDAIVTCLV